MSTFSKLSREQKIERLLDLRARLRGRERGAPVAGLRLEPDPAGRYQPFPLTDLQESFLTGKRLASVLRGGDQVGCHIYCEIDVADLDVIRLERAWLRLLSRHDMLRAVVYEDGRQQVRERAPEYRIEVDDLQHLGERERERRLASIRQTLSHKIYQPGQWPLFEIRATAHPGGVHRLHISVDEWIVDGISLNRLLDEWFLLYRDPDHRLPELAVSFRDYALALTRAADTPAFQRSLEYWVDKLGSGLEGPGLPHGPDAASRERRRLSFELSDAAWDRFRAAAMHHGVAPASVLMVLFAELIRSYQDRPRIGLILTFFNRLPVHPDIQAVVGPFTSTSVFVHRDASAQQLADAARAAQEQQWADLDHVLVSGIRALREARRRNQAPVAPDAFNIVFTNLLNNSERTGAADDRIPTSGFRDNMIYFVTQTPQVYLDCQVADRKGRLYISWDVAEARFEKGVIENLFAAFHSAVDRVAACAPQEYAAPVADFVRASDRAGGIAPSLDPEGPRALPEPAAAHEPFPLTAQQSAYAYARLGAASGQEMSCTVYQEIEFDDLDVDRLARAWDALVVHHGMLRCVPETSGFQRVRPHVEPYPFSVCDLSARSAVDRDAALADIARSMSARNFALGQWPLFEIRVSRLSARSHRVHFAIDMLIADGRSIQTLCRQWLQCYRDPTMTPRPGALCYRDYVLALERFKQSEAGGAAREYWRRKLGDLPPGPLLPRGHGSNLSARHLARQIPGFAAIERKASELGVSAGVVLLGVYIEVLCAFTGGSELTVVVPSWTRLAVHPDVDRLVGDFTALAWIRAADPSLSLADKLREYERELRQDLAHSAVSGIEVLRQDRSSRKHRGSRFPVVFTVPDPVDELPPGVRFGRGASKTPGIDLDCISVIAGDVVQVSFDAAPEVDAHTVDRMFDDYCRRLEHLTDASRRAPAPWAPLSVLDGPRAFEGLLDRCLHEHIEDTAARHPTRIALQTEDEHMSYAELDVRANRLAHRLISAGVGPGQRVGVLATRSMDMVVALLGILKSGAAYLPLDPGYPQERLAFLIEDADVSVVLAQRQFTSALQRIAVERVYLDQVLDRFPAHAPGPRAAADDIAYVIYTSGSTGKPKGCLIEHRAICNRLLWMQERYPIDEQDRVLQKTPFTFDVSVWEFFWPLMFGARMVIARPDGHRDSRYLAELIRSHEVTVCHFVPSMLGFFVREPGAVRCRSLRHLFASGEALSYSLMETCLRTVGAELHNLYGPTEAAVDVTYWDCGAREDSVVPIGRPVANTSIYVLDDALQPVPVGVEGEIHLGGVQLARGYLNRPELTEERFITAVIADRGAVRLYKTGDRGRVLADGTVEYLGRLDLQVKVRGFRVELGEIEAALQELPDIRAGAVMLRDAERGDPKLVAYAEPAPGSRIDAAMVRRALATRLPEHMLPNLVVSLPSLPVGRHGKLDRDALPWPISLATADAPHGEARASVSRPDLVDAITSQFARELHGQRIPEHADLFDHGVTSLTLVNVSQRIDAEYGLTPPVEELLVRPTIGWIADFLHDHLGGGEERAAQDPDRTPQPARSAEPPRDGVIVELEPVSLSEHHYQERAPVGSFSTEILRLERLGLLLSLFRHARRSDSSEPRALFPSAGGKFSVQIYLQARPGRIRDLPAGIYYYHPEQNALYPAGEPASESHALLFHELYRRACETAAFVIYLVVRLEAIEPVYGGAGKPLATVEAGYMTQLLLDHQREFGLGFMPVAVADLDRIHALCGLDSGQMVLATILGGPCSADSSQEIGSIIERLDASGVALHDAWRSHAAYAPRMSGALQPMAAEMAGEPGKAGIEPFSPAVQPIVLPAHPVPAAAYRQRASQREFDDQPLASQRIAGLLSLLRSRSLAGRQAGLSHVALSPDAIDVYVVAEPGRVAGLPGGLYRYDAPRHRLIRIRAELGVDLATCHTPYNRRHYRRSAFSMFLVHRAGRDARLLGPVARHLALLQAGAMGQVLMDHQAELAIGLCPIGGLNFERLRPDFDDLDPDHDLVHAFIGGALERADLVRLDNALLPATEPRWSARSERARPVDVAIIGMSGRYPGAGDLDALWDNLRAGRRTITEIPQHRWDGERLYHRDGSEGKSHSKWGGFLADVDRFDHRLFGISPREARLIDPQERLALEAVWACLESAGHTAHSLARATEGRVGVFVGVMWSDYQNFGVEALAAGHTERSTSLHSSIANRVSHVFDFIGPSIALDTSCSSALTAVHLAHASLQRDECQAAVVVGVNLITHRYHHNLLCQLGLVGKDDRSNAFGAQGSGWVAGEGVGALLLRPLDMAVMERDHVLGTLAGVAVGHAGRSSRYGAPRFEAQSRSMRAALKDAGIEPGAVSYIESSATGTGVADAVEVQAIKAIFGRDVSAGEDPCLIGSIKPNIGHLESASGMSQIAKVLLQMHHGTVAPTVVDGALNPLLQLRGTGLEICREARPWTQRPRRALVNGFGATGSSGHVVLAEHIEPAREPWSSQEPLLFPLSAATVEQLRTYARRLLRYLEQSPHARLDDVAFTLQVGRTPMRERLAIIASDRDALLERLARAAAGPQDGDDPGVSWGRAEFDSTIPGQNLDLATAARAWVRGSTLPDPGSALAGARRIALPTYPFAREKHWTAAPDAPGDAHGAAHPGEHGDEPVQPAPTPASEQLQAGAEHYLRGLFARVLEEHPDALDARTPLEDHGLTSLMIEEVSAVLARDVGITSKSLFFQHRTLAELARYLSSAHGHALRAHLGLAPAAPRVDASPASPATTATTATTALIGEGEARGPGRAGDIAVIGAACRFPQASDLEAFWRNLREGRDCITEIPADRWPHEMFFDPDGERAGTTYSRWGGFVDDHDMFDPTFFRITPAEARFMAPQERLFLQTAWAALEDAACPPGQLKERFGGRVGVFVGAMYSEYQLYSQIATGRGGVAVGSIQGSIANRVSYVLDLNGPSLTVDTLCSSSLVALHLAMNAIAQGDCDAAIVGGVNLSIHPNKYVLHAQTRMSSSDGRCRSFGRGGDGFVPGEGVAAILIAPLSRAIADRDSIHAVIKGTAVNHGGRSNGYTVPNPGAQIALVREALSRAEIDPRTVTYVEAHGTGTALGDPIEMEALTAAFREHTADSGYCAVGSVKSNIGHLESAAGMAGLIKVLLQMRYRSLAPTLHAEEPNPHIDFGSSPFFLQRSFTPWESATDREGCRVPLRAALSSFGAGGANAHVILEQAPARPLAAPAPGEHLIVLSARTPDRLDAYAAELLRWLDAAPARAQSSARSERRGPDMLRELVAWSNSQRDGAELGHHWSRLRRQAEALLELLDAPDRATLDAETIRAAVVAALSAIAGVDRGNVAASADLGELGLDVVALRTLGEWAENTYGATLPPLAEMSSIDALVAHIAASATTGSAARDHSADEKGLASIAYTLQVGREPMAERLAVVARSTEELHLALAAYCRGEQAIPGLYRGRARSREDSQARYHGPRDSHPSANDPAIGSAVEPAIGSMVQRRDLAGLAGAWVRGADIDWRALHPTPCPLKVSLPTYPFARERYWVDHAWNTEPRMALSPSSPDPSAARPAADLVSTVRTILAEVVELPAEILDERRDLAELGVDSIVSMRLSNRLEKALGQPLSARELVGLRTVTAIARYLAQRATAAPRALAPAKVEIAFPLSWEQRRYWGMSLAPGVRAALTLPLGFRITGTLDRDRLLDCVQATVARHDSLRCTYQRTDKGDQVIQSVVATLDIPVSELDLSTLDAPRARAEALVWEQLAQPLPLDQAPPLRVLLIRLHETEHWLVINVHHIAFDAISMALFSAELQARYSALASASPPLPVPTSYAEYVAWEQAELPLETLEQRRDHWRRELTGLRLGLDLPVDYLPDEQPVPSRPADPIIRDLGAPVSAAVQRFAAEHGLSPFTVYLAGLGLLLFGLTENETIVIGNPAANRDKLEFEPMIGLLANLSAIVMDFSGDPTLVELCHRTAEAVRQRDRHVLPYSEWVRVVQRARTDRGSSPLQVVLNYFVLPAAALPDPGPDIEFEPLDLIRSGRGFDWFLTLVARPDSTLMRWEYDPARFAPAAVAQRMAGLERALGAITGSPDTTLGALLERGDLGAVRPYHVRIAATFTADPIEPVFDFWQREIGEPLRVRFAGYDQVLQELLDPGSELGSNPRGLNVVLLRPSDWLGNQAHEPAGKDGSSDPLALRMAELARAVTEAGRTTRVPLLVALCPDAPEREADKAWSQRRQTCLEPLVRAVEELSTVTLLDSRDLLALYDITDYYQPERERLGNISYDDRFFSALGTAIVRHLYRTIIPPAKVLVLDCDNTLWRGVVGEDGVHGIELDEASRALQAFAASQEQAGVLVCLCSKNEEADVLEVFERRQDMLLHKDQLVAHRINWESKSANIRALAETLDLGEDSFVFIDDNPIEIAEVRAACPGVIAVQRPETSEDMKRLLAHLWVLDHGPATAEDRQRTAYYRRDLQRQQFRSQSGTFGQFIAGLELCVDFQELGDAALSRASQLTFRTNQFNATTRRRSEADLQAWLERPEHRALVVQVRDRFGDYGMVGVVLCQLRSPALIVDTFLLSCRVLGRGVEYQIVRHLAALAREHDLGELRIPFVPTLKNRPMKRFLDEIGAGHCTNKQDTYWYILPQTMAASVQFSQPAGSTGEAPVTQKTGGTDSGALPPARIRFRNRLMDRLWRDYGDIDRLHAAVRQRTRYMRPATDPPVPARTATEARLIEIFTAALNIDEVGIEDDFYAIGGTSLEVIHVLAEIELRLGVALSLHEFMETPTVLGLARRLASSGATPIDTSSIATRSVRP